MLQRAIKVLQQGTYSQKSAEIVIYNNININMLLIGVGMRQNLEVDEVKIFEIAQEAL